MAKRNQQRADHKFLYQLLSTPSPTGYEVAIQRVVKSYIAPFADSVTVDLHGNLTASLMSSSRVPSNIGGSNSRNSSLKKRIMLAGHCDQIGLIIRHITKDGFLLVDKLGGIDIGVLYGSRVTILNKKGPVTGIIGRKPIHLQTADERAKTPHDIEKIWIDIGAKNKSDAEKYLQVGDAVAFEPVITELKNGLIACPGLDNRVGLYVVIETLRRLHKAPLSVDIFSVSTVQEEVGFRGAKTAATSISPEVGIAVDVTHGNDNPGNESTKSEECKLGSGPTIARGPNINPVVEERLLKVAKKNKIPHQISPKGGLLGTDANEMQVARAGGVATASIGIPNRYMHSQVEVCHLDDLENTIELLCAFIKEIKEDTDFTPC